MSNEEPVEGRCNATARDGGYCALVAGHGTDHVGEGRCKFHGGASSGAPKGNVNAQKHAIYTQRSNYYNNLPAEQKAWVDELVNSMMEDAERWGLFTRDNFYKFKMVREIAIDMHKKRRGNDYIAEEGIVQENVVTDENGDPLMRDGELVTETDENPVNLAYDRLDRTTTRKLKELGFLDDPESKKAEAGKTLAEQLAEMRQEMDPDDEENTSTPDSEDTDTDDDQ